MPDALTQKHFARLAAHYNALRTTDLVLGGVLRHLSQVGAKRFIRFIQVWPAGCGFYLGRYAGIVVAFRKQWRH